jgi:hypothetical protein
MDTNELRRAHVHGPRDVVPTAADPRRQESWNRAASAASCKMCGATAARGRQTERRSGRRLHPIECLARLRKVWTCRTSSAWASTPRDSTHRRPDRALWANASFAASSQTGSRLLQPPSHARDSFCGEICRQRGGMKALGTGHSQEVLWRDIEVVRRGGPPQLQFHGGAAGDLPRWARDPRCSPSLTPKPSPSRRCC